MSLKIKILEEYKPEFLSALEDTDVVKFWGKLLKHGVISYDKYWYHDFSALDHDHLDSMLKARYLWQVVFNILQENESLYDNFMKVLTKFKEMEDLGYYIAQELSKETANLECHGNLSSSTAAGAGGPRRDNRFVLREDHIPKLLQILADCSHKWEQIGIALELPPSVIAECTQGASNEIRLYHVLIWYQNNKVADLKTIKDALDNPIVALSSKSRDLEERFEEMIIPMMSSQKRPRLDSYIGTQSVDTEVTDGKSTLLGVQVQQGESISYQWMKNGKWLHNNSIYSGIDTDILFIKHARQGIEGEYSCHIKVSNNETTTKKVQLTIKYLPEKKSLLRRYYRLKEVPADFWPPLGSSTFISLALVHDERKIKKEYDFSVRGDIDDIIKEKNMVKYENLFAKYKEGALIFVEGRPGSGKTTLTHKLTRDWATRPDVLNGAKLVFLVSLRVLCLFKENKTLSGILNRFYDDHILQTKVKEMLERESGEGVCFIIDGLDEYPERNVATNIIQRLICKQYLPSAMIIVASRPIGTVELRHSAQITKRIEVLGFSKDQILNYVKEYFNSGNDAQELQDYLRSHINIFHMCYLPVHAAMICFIYSRPGATVPNTETKVYEYFTLLTIKRKQKRDEDKKECSTLKGLDGNIKESFKKVCQLAFDMTVKSKQTTDTSESGVCLSDDGSDIHSLGLVTIDAAAKLFDFKDSYSFLHLTFQEFLAAFYITELKEVEQLRILNDHIHKKEMLMVWKFFCGLNMFTDPQDSKLQKIMTSELINDLYKSQCAFESQQPTVCDAIFVQNRTRVMTFKDHIFLPTEFKAIAYVISAVSVPVTEMVFDNCTLDQSGVTAFIEEASDKLIHIKSLSLSIQNDTEQFKVLNLLLKHLQFLKVLDLRNTEIEKSEITSLTDNITLPSLNILKICMPLKQLSWRQYDPVNVLKTLSFNSSVLEEVQYNIYCESDHETHKQSLIHLLKSFKCKIVPLCDIKDNLLSNIDVDLSVVPSFLQLSRLILVNCSLDDSQLENLVNIELDKSLETIRLDFNKITCKGATTVSQLMGKCTKLAQLSLSCNQIGDQGAIALSGALVHVPYLLELDLEGNTLGDEGAIALARAAKLFSAEFQLLLCNISITPVGTKRILEYRPTTNVKEAYRPVESWKFVIVYSPQVISRAMQCCAHLKTLNLSGRRIGSPGTKALAGGLHHCNKLENLNLSNCGIGRDGVRALSEQVQYCQELKTLNLSSNKINCDHVYQLARGLKSCSNLRELDLCQNNIGNDGIEELAYELKDCALEKLRLNENGIGRNGAASLAKWLRSGVGLWKFEANAGDISKHILLENFLSINLNNHVRRHGLDGEEENMAAHMWCSSLLELDLGNNKICSEGAAALGYGLKCCSNIQSLNLAENTIREDGAEILAYGLENCVTLQTLNLDKNRIGYSYSGAAAISAALSSCNKLQVLSITESDIAPEGAKILLSGLKTCSKLEILRFGSNSIGSDGAKALGECLQVWKHLQELNIGKSGIDSDGATELMQGLKNSCSLQELHLHDNNINTDSLRALSESLKYTQLQYLNLSNIGSPSIDDIATLSDGLKQCTKLQILDLSSNKLGSPGIKLLAKGLKLFKHLRYLNLSDNNIESDGAKSLAEGLQCCTFLQTLVLNFNRIGSDGATALFAGLKGCSRLEYLHLRQNYIGSEGANAVAKWIVFTCPSSLEIYRKQSNIQALDLAHNNIGVEGTITLARALKYCTKLQKLDLQNNDIGPNGAVELAEGIKNCVNLKLLNLDNTKIGTAGIISLCEGLKYCRSIRILYLRNDEIDSNGASALAESLKYCATLNELNLIGNAIYYYNVSELASKLKYCNIYTIYGLTNPAVRREESRRQEYMDSLPDSDSD